MKKYIFTDLACEAYEKENNSPPLVKEYRRGTNDEILVFDVCIDGKEQEMRYRRPSGCYRTLQCKKIWSMNEAELSSLRIAVTAELMSMLDIKRSPLTILVVGLGNPSFTVDALGPSTVKKIHATRHLERGKNKKQSGFSLATMSPGVLAESGMEAVEQVRGVVSAIGADVVLAIDALAAREYERIGATVQLSDAGICPGSGVGNHRLALTQETVGVPVVAIGVPTVVNLSTVFCDALAKGGMDSLTPKMDAVVSSLRGRFVCPKESDWIVEGVAFLLAEAINRLVE